MVIYPFGVFCMYRYLDCYKHYEPTYHNNNTGLLYGFFVTALLQTKHGYFTIILLRVCR